jgi:PE-PPE domain-containing protein
MPGQKLRWFTAGMFASAGAGMLSLTSMMNPAFAFAVPDVPPPPPDIGVFVGASGTPIPGPDYVGAAYELYVDPTYTTGPGAITSFYQGTTDNPLGNGVFTPEGLYPLEAAGVHQLYLNYPLDANGLPDLSSSVGQGAFEVQSTVLGLQTPALNSGLTDSASTVFGYSQGSTLNGIAMQLLDPTGTPETGALDPKFLLIADPSNPNGGLLERFNGFETTSGQTTVDPLNLPSLGISFDGATPADDYTTTIYSLEYDGFADFPRYPLNFLSDLNAFLGIAELHGTYLNAAGGESGPSPTDIANAVHLTTSGDTLTNYYMITTDTIGGVDGPVTPPLVSTLGDLPVIGKPLEDLLGPDLTVLINLGYGGDNLGYSDAPANIATPFGLAPDVNSTTLMNELTAGAQSGFAAFEKDLSDPAALFSSLTESSTTSGPSLSDILTTLEADFSSPEAASTTLTELANAFSSAASTAYSTLLPLTDIGNALTTSLPAYELSLFTDNLATGDLTDAFGLPLAANTALDTLSAGFAYEVVSTAASQIAADFSAIGF